MSILGKVTFRINDEYSSRVLRFVMSEHLQAEDIVSKGGSLYLTAGYEFKRGISDYLGSIGAEYEIVGEQGTVTLLKRLLAKKGLLLGSIVSLIVIFVMSDLIFSFEVLCDDPQLRDEIMGVLYQNGIYAGCSSSGLDLTAAERELKRSIDGISWAGISIQGCKAVIDVVENVPKPEYTQKRLPTNLIARENGVVEKIDLLDGQLMTTVGSGVRKGDMLISGDVIGDLNYSRHGFVKHFYVHYYTRSLGKVYGTFERTETFFQPYSTTEKTLTGEHGTKTMISLFDVDIPLFFPEESMSKITPLSDTPLTFFGVELPIGIKTVGLDEYTISERPLSAEQAERRAEQLAETYEHNFLGDFELRSREQTVDIRDDGVCLTVKYTLYGVISEEVEFFISK